MLGGMVIWLHEGYDRSNDHDRRKRGNLFGSAAASHIGEGRHSLAIRPPGESGCSALSIVKQGDLMVVANVGDSRVVLDIAFDDDVITPSSSSST
uniref:protein-serine/threonine phosphatase n=1 Tax=Zea mays TaxID=4577 RepID=A0A804R637_MAIZE